MFVNLQEADAAQPDPSGGKYARGEGRVKQYIAEGSNAVKKLTAAVRPFIAVNIRGNHESVI